MKTCHRKDTGFTKKRQSKVFDQNYGNSQSPNPMSLNQLSLGLLVLFFLPACGGGGSYVGDPSQPPVTGTEMDGAMASEDISDEVSFGSTTFGKSTFE